METEASRNDSPVPSESLPPTLRQQYAAWLSETLTSEFGPGPYRKSHASVIFFGNHASDRDAYGIEGHIVQAFHRFVPQESKGGFRSAVADVITQRVTEPEPDLKEIRSLVFLAVDINAVEASSPLAEALLSNQVIRDDSEISSRIYDAIFWMTIQEYVQNHRDQAYTATQRLINDPAFDERWLYQAVKALLSFDPRSAADIIGRYADRINAFKKTLDEESISSYRITSKYLIEDLQEKSVELTPEMIAILEI